MRVVSVAHLALLATDGQTLPNISAEYTTVAARMLPEEFTMTQLRTVYEAVWNTTLAAGNFTRQMLPQLEDTGRKSKASTGAPAALFTATDRHIHPPLAKPASK